MTLPVLPLRDMSDRHRGLTRALAESYVEAARVSLGRHHEPPQEFTLQNASPGSNEELLILLEWDRLMTAVVERGPIKMTQPEMELTRVQLRR
jgi:hypothetical protein